MTLIQMRYFYEVCQWQNITKAAEHLHVSQPTISVAMQTLEAETGLNLFHREGRKIIVTNEGEKLLGKVKHILDQIDQLKFRIWRIIAIISAWLCLCSWGRSFYREY